MTTVKIKSIVLEKKTEIKDLYGISEKRVQSWEKGCEVGRKQLVDRSIITEMRGGPLELVVIPPGTWGG